jgi:nicotinate-nucleotide--dimethylbenzimidazole phosphoribosyltransferase
VSQDPSSAEAEERLTALASGITPTSPEAERRAWERLDRLTKPPRSLGRLEEIAARLARIQATDHPHVEHKTIVLAAADHGVATEGVSPYPQEVTAQMVANFASGGAAINQIAAAVGADLVLVDAGVRGDVSSAPGVLHAKLAPGTATMTTGPAMTRALALEAVGLGSDIATDLAARGERLIGTGEMGIGNTTAAAALTSAYTGAGPDSTAGPGTGLDEAGLRHKRDVVRRALEANASALEDPLDTLAALGGLEIAVLAGVVLGAAAAGVATVVDGFISSSAALAAARIAPAASDYLFLSHRSTEPGHAILLEELGLGPVLDLEMRLGEGTGAALAMGIIDAAARMMSHMSTFDEAGVSHRSKDA